MRVDQQASVLGKAVAIGLLGELADKTFFVTLFLGIWCPWQGIREGKVAFGERCLVFVGAAVALVVRLIVLNSAPVVQMVSSWFDVASCAALAILGIRATLQRRFLSESGEKQPTVVSATPDNSGGTTWNQAAFSWLPTMPKNPFSMSEGADDTVPSDAEWNKSAFPSVAKPVEQEGLAYGTMSPPPSSASGVFSERISDSTASTLIAGPLACALVFIVEADDKSETALNDFGKTGLQTVLGSIIGFLLALFVAVFLGAFAEWNLSRRQAFVPVIFGMLSLSLVSLSQALLHLPGLRSWSPTDTELSSAKNSTVQ
mmetsp:Transcript_58810/g.136874  ORF Transcript_58810/g.136874 Transcript_58810/m.136874 type:complete len:315 (+) Transcript_58810:70-1014(+)|eukprot:CAMPEP_0171097768 /NCGR_PEP_ID=MMETSP0766_2-20121228/47738_1 /TAXON_ID=439317 /ORGANISM="Gambierdiscus australes, Strain CAWD 149" /LENGTH=314 /DNA_ID=CAMNT_0011557015 /DNA_START=66 /DNA_END=1010 /DNA_ORIENTATION=+